MCGRAAAAASLLGGWLLAAPEVASGQQPAMLQRCAVASIRADVTDRAPAPTDTVWLYRGNFVLECPRERKRVSADSADYLEVRQQLRLYGRVRYTEPGAELRARTMVYYKADDHVEAVGDVRATLENGSTMRGPEATYYTRNEQIGRPTESLSARGRPHFEIVDRDTATGRTDTTIVDAQTVMMHGDLIYGGGDVEIVRTDFRATGDSVFVDKSRKGTAIMQLMREPRVEGKGEQDYTITGFLIEALTEGRELKRVISRRDAVVESPDLLLKSDTVELHLVNKQPERAIAWGASRATAETRDLTLVADSLDILTPGRKLEEVRATGTAHLEFSDTTIITTERNFVDGDTVIARFEEQVVPRRSAPGDTTALREPASQIMDTVTRPTSLLAVHNARVFYQSVEEGARPDCPNIQYAAGHRIDIAMEPGKSEIQTMLVVGKDGPTQGLRSTCTSAPPPGGASGARRDTIPPP